MATDLMEKEKKNVEQNTQNREKIIHIVGYGDMVENKNQIKIDIINIDQNLIFDFEKSKQFSFENCENKIIFKKLTKDLNTKNLEPIQVSSNQILSKIFTESKKFWDTSIFSKLEYEAVSLNFYSKDDLENDCFIKVYVMELHKLKIVILPAEMMTDYILKGNYIGTHN